MSNSPGPASSSAASKSKLATQSPHHQTVRTPSDSGRQSALFQRELDRLGKSDANKEGERTGTTADKSENCNIDEREGEKGGQEQNSRHFSELPSDAMASAIFRAAKMTATQMPSAPQLPAEHLARIAAAIQELVANGATASYQLQLPLGNMLIQGAVLGRDAKGHLAIQLLAAGNMSPDQLAQLRSDLMRRMERKRLKIASLEVNASLTSEPRREGGSSPRRHVAQSQSG